MQIKKPLGSVAHLFSNQNHEVYWGFCSKSFYTTYSSQERNMSRELVKWIQNNQFIKNKYQSAYEDQICNKKDHFWAWFLSIQLDSFQVPVSGYQGRDV